MRSIWRRIADFSDTRAAAATVFVLALAAFGIQSLAWPLRQGRDGATYLEYFVDMWHTHPAYPFLMLFRTPLAPLVFGVLLRVGGATLAEAAMALAYATSILAFVLVARYFGRAAANLTAVALLLYPAYGALFHQISSDPIFALTLALWLLALARAIAAPTIDCFVLVGVGVVAMVLARPGAEPLVLAGLVPLFLHLSRRRRLELTVAALGTAALLLVGWASYNDARYGDFTVARGTWAGTPFYRTFVMEKIVKPQNGRASRELAAAVESDLLTREPYVSHHVTVHQFFSTEDDYMWEDLVVLSDRKWGWNSNYSILRRVAVEAIEKNPHLYARDVAAGMWSEVISPYRWQVTSKAATAAAATPTAAPAPPSTAALGGTTWWLASTPNGRKPSPSRIDRQEREVKSLLSDVPNRSGSSFVASLLDAISRAFPRMAIWLFGGLLLLAIRRPRGSIALLVLVCACELIVLVTLLGYGPTPEYGLPFDPVLILFGACALLGTPRAGLRFPHLWRNR